MEAKVGSNDVVLKDITVTNLTTLIERTLKCQVDF